MASSTDLKAIYTEAYPLIEQQLDLADLIAGLREKATAIGLDWSQIKALLKAQIQDERDETGGRKRVRKIIDKAEHASAYADMLGLAKMNEENFSAGQSYADQKGRGEAKLVETIVKGVQTEVGRKALVTALDIMIDSETGEVIEDQPETATVPSPEKSGGNGSRDHQHVHSRQADGAKHGGQDGVPAGADRATNSPSTGVTPSAGCTAPSESAADEISDPAQPSPPKQAEPIKAGEGVPPSSPAILSDEEVVPAFMKDKPGCLKLRDGHCKISFATEALCAECADKRARAMA